MRLFLLLIIVGQSCLEKKSLVYCTQKMRQSTTTLLMMAVFFQKNRSFQLFHPQTKSLFEEPNPLLLTRPRCTSAAVFFQRTLRRRKAKLSLLSCTSFFPDPFAFLFLVMLFNYFEQCQPNKVRFCFLLSLVWTCSVLQDSSPASVCRCCWAAFSLFSSTIDCRVALHCIDLSIGGSYQTRVP
jgi:hypothetical protein